MVDFPKSKKAIGTKWFFKNKKDKRGIVIKNKARLVAHGNTQEEGIDYDEVFAPVVRIEAIRLFLAYASFMGFMVYQMDVKSDFLYRRIKEEVYVCQPLRFEDHNHPNKVYKVVKVLYGLHQAPRAWYETSANYLLGNRFHRGNIDWTLFIKRQKGDILLIQVYVDDIIYGSTKKELCTKFKRLVKDKFQMSSMGELTFFLGLQVNQKEDGIFISHDKYVDEVLRKFSFSDVKSANTTVDMKKTLVKDADGDDVDVYLYRSMIESLMYLTTSRPDIMYEYPRDSSFELVAYTDNDYVRASLDKKSTTESCQFLRSRLISWQCKKQIVVATSTTEAEYVDAASCCGQATSKVTTVNGEKQIQALVDKKKVYITETSVISDLHLEDAKDEHVTITSNDPLSGEDRMKLTKLMELCTQLQSRVLTLETTKASQALEIKSLKRRVKKLEKKEDASKQGRMIANLDVDEGVALVEETQGRNDQDMFDTSIFYDEEVVAEKEVNTADPVLTTGEVVTTAGVEVKTAAIISQISLDDITLAKSLVDIKISKPKAKGIVIQEPSETPTPTAIDSSQKSSKAKDKGKTMMIEPEKPLKKKDQILID
uniref:Putative ribonuclease H-like domain-containing protein n=1 Tax=Tanacetum cinerariifolium TaxID=118510 RepID=A0A6L2JPI4_TANCI|nr:putative ribonuclease H-like domain-containing protein [Tanacetum cinerariifolium]